MNSTTAPNEQDIRDLLAKLKTRRPDTKFRLLKMLSSMDEGWHSLGEISESAAKSGIVASHLFESLIELCRTSLIESDWKGKRYPRLTNFRVSPFGLLAEKCHGS
jgi:hypothetical protein